MHKIKILSTRKIKKSQRAKLNKERFSWREKDFIRIEFLPFNIKNINTESILLFTSKNAVFSLLENKNIDFLKKNSCICVGEKTKELLIQNGFNVLDFTDYAKDLTQIIAKKHNKKSFVFFCGNLRQDTLPDFFRANAITFDEIQLYKTEFLPAIIEKKNDVILFFSPSGVESYLQKNTISDEVCFCIGTTTAQTLSSHTKAIIIPKKPTIENLIEKINDYFIKNKKQA